MGNPELAMELDFAGNTIGGVSSQAHDMTGYVENGTL